MSSSRLPFNSLAEFYGETEREYPNNNPEGNNQYSGGGGGNSVLDKLFSSSANQSKASKAAQAKEVKLMTKLDKSKSAKTEKALVKHQAKMKKDAVIGAFGSEKE